VVFDRLQRAKSRPIFVQDAVRTALRDFVAWRCGGGKSPGPEAFIAAALAAARLALDEIDCDAAERSRTLASVERAAGRFTRTALGRRLLNVPAARFLRLPRTANGPDAVVRDRQRHVHAIVLTTGHDALEAGQIASRVAAATPLAIADRLKPLTVHVFSLTTAHRRTFERDVCTGRTDRAVAARVA
jgi:hypothetical protein